MPGSDLYAQQLKCSIDEAERRSLASLHPLLVAVRFQLGQLAKTCRLQRAFGSDCVALMPHETLKAALSAAAQDISRKQPQSDSCPVCCSKFSHSLCGGAAAAPPWTGLDLSPAALHFTCDSPGDKAGVCWHIVHGKPADGKWFLLRGAQHSSMVSQPSATHFSPAQVLSWHLPPHLPGNVGLPPAKALARGDLFLSKALPCSMVLLPGKEQPPSRGVQGGVTPPARGTAARLLRFLGETCGGSQHANVGGAHVLAVSMCHEGDLQHGDTGEALTDGCGSVTPLAMARMYAVYRALSKIGKVAARRTDAQGLQLVMSGDSSTEAGVVLPNVFSAQHWGVSGGGGDAHVLPSGGTAATPAAFQGRIGGYKGVWYVDHRLQSRVAPLLPQQEHKQPLSGGGCLHLATGPSMAICARDSQRKLHSPAPAPLTARHLPQCEVEVLRWSAPSGAATLNQQLVLLLLAWGVPLSALQGVMGSALQRIRGLTSSEAAALTALRAMGAHLDTEGGVVADDASDEGDSGSTEGGAGGSLWPSMPPLHAGGSGPGAAAAVDQWVGAASGQLSQQCYRLLRAGLWGEHALTARLVRLQELQGQRLQAKLNASVPASRRLLMLPDPTGLLQPHQIFLRISDWEGGGTQDAEGGAAAHVTGDGVVKGPVIVARSPAYAAHDVLSMTAVDILDLQLQAEHNDEHKEQASTLQDVLHYRGSLVDVVLFPVTWAHGSVARLLAGGDFDGDTAWVCWDDALVSPVHTAQRAFAQHVKGALSSPQAAAIFRSGEGGAVLDAMAWVEKQGGGLAPKVVYAFPAESTGPPDHASGLAWLAACMEDSTLGAASTLHSSWLDHALRWGGWLAEAQGTPPQPGWAALQRPCVQLAVTAAAAVDGAKAGLKYSLPGDIPHLARAAYLNLPGSSSSSSSSSGTQRASSLQAMHDESQLQMPLTATYPSWMGLAAGSPPPQAVLPPPTQHLPTSPLQQLKVFVADALSSRDVQSFLEPPSPKNKGGSADSPADDSIADFLNASVLDSVTPAPPPVPPHEDIALHDSAHPPTPPLHPLPLTQRRLAPHPPLRAASIAVHAEDYAALAAQHCAQFTRQLATQGEGGFDAAVQAARRRMVQAAAQVVKGGSTQPPVLVHAPPGEAQHPPLPCRPRAVLNFEIKRIALAYYTHCWAEYAAPENRRVAPLDFAWWVASDVLVLTAEQAC